MKDQSDTPLRYVIFHHTGIPQPHYDLMFERHPGGPLLTVRSPAWPIARPVAVHPLDDHRRDYLDYEGPVSNDRGTVRRVQSGSYEGTVASGHLVLLTPTTTELRISRITDADWMIEPRQPGSSTQQ